MVRFITSSSVVCIFLDALSFLDVASSTFIAPAASPPVQRKGPAAPAKQNTAVLKPLEAPHSLNHVDATAAANQANAGKIDRVAEAKLEKLNRACPCQGQAAGIGETGCLCNMKWKNVYVDRAPTAKLTEKSITLTTLIPTLVNLGTTMVPQDVTTIHATEYPQIVATSMIPTEWPEFLGTTLVPQEHTTFEMRPSVVGTTLVPEWVIEEPGRMVQQVVDCINCGAGFLQAARKPPKGYSCCSKSSL